MPQHRRRVKSSLFSKLSEASSAVVETLKSTASSVSHLSHPTTPSDVGQTALKVESRARDATRKDWKGVCAELKREKAKLTKLRSERNILRRKKSDAKVNVQRGGVIGKLPFSSRTMCVEDRLEELDVEISNLEDEIGVLEQDKADLKAKLDELDATIATTGREAVQQGGINPEYSDMRDFDGILNET